MAVTDPDLISRYDVIYGANSQKISIFPISDTQRGTNGIVDCYVSTAGTGEITSASSDFDAAVAVDDIVCVINGPDAGHYFVETDGGTTSVNVSSIDLGSPSVTTPAQSTLTANAVAYTPNTAYAGDVLTMDGAHGYATGDPIMLTAESGGAGAQTVPLLGTVYYVIWLSSTTLSLATTYANAITGTVATLNDGGSTHTAAQFDDRLIVAVFANGANGTEAIEGNDTSGDATGDVETGITIQALYSYGKDEWKDDGLASGGSEQGTLPAGDGTDYNDDLIRIQFPYEAITSEQFEIGGGASHDNWTWFNVYSRKKVRTGGWADKDINSNTDTDYTGIVTLGAVDDTTSGGGAGQVYYQQSSTITPKVDFTFSGAVDESIEVFNENVDASTNNITIAATTLTRASGNWVDDGYVVGDVITIRNSETANAANDGDHIITTLSTTVLTASASTFVTTTNPDTTLLAAVSKKTYLKLFLRKKGRGYAGSTISDIGVSTIQTIVNRFPLTHATDAAITLSDANLFGLNPYRFSATPVAFGGVGQTDGVSLTTGAVMTLTPTVSPTFLTANITVGDILRITAATTSTMVGYYEITVVTETTVTVKESESIANTNDFTFTTAWDSDEGSITYEVYTTKILSDKTAEDAADLTADTGIINVAPATLTAGYLGKITNTAANFGSVAAGDLLVLTGSTAGNTKGIFKVVDSSYDGNAANPTTTDLFLNTVDRAFPGSVDANATFQVFEPGMYLQFKDDTTETKVSSGTVNETIDFASGGRTITLGSALTIWDASIGAGTIIEVTGVGVNNGSYTVLERTSDTVLTLISTDSVTTETGDGDPIVTVTVKEGFRRTIGSGTFAFNWKISGNGGTLANVFEVVQKELRSSADIDYAGGISVGNITDLLMTFASPTGVGLNMFIDNLASSDINNATYNDHSGVARKFPFTSSGNLVFNANLVADSAAKYWLYFTNDDAGDNQGRDFGSQDAVIVKDATSSPVDITGDVNGTGNHTGIAGTLSGGSISIPFTYDYDGNTQRGSASTSTTAPVTLVAIGLSSAQYVIATGNITDSTTIVVSAVSAIERNYLVGTV